MADRQSDPFARAVEFARVAAGLTKVGQVEAAKVLFAEAEALAAGLAEPEDQAVVLTVIAVALIDAARVGDALALVERVKDLGLKTDRMRRAYITVAEALIAVGKAMPPCRCWVWPRGLRERSWRRRTAPAPCWRSRGC